MEELKTELEDLFTQGFKAFPNADEKRLDESQPYRLGYAAALRLDELERERGYIMAKAKELSGGAVFKAGFAP